MFATLAGLARAQDGAVVRRIEFDGLVNHKRENVLLKMQTREGQPWSRRTWEADYLRLMKTGWFDNIRISPRSVLEGPDAVVLVLQVLENDRIRDIRFAGNRHFDDKDLADGAFTRRDEFVSGYRLEADRKRIVEKYLEDGYAFVKVDARTVSGAEGAVAVFTVREGPRVRVRDIEFHGNKELSGFKLRGEMETKRSTVWTLLSPPVWKEEQFDRDLTSLARYARGEGFLDAKFYLRELVWNEDRTRVDLHIQVEEGIQYVVDGVSIAGNTVFATEELLRDLRAQPGEPAGMRKIGLDEQMLLDRYREAAYVDVDVEFQQTILPDRPGRVRLAWKIREGSIVYVGRIDFFGNHRTREKVLRREMRMLPGEEMNLRLLQQSLARLNSKGYFEPPPPELQRRAWHAARDPGGVIVVEALPGTTPDTRDLAIHVREGRTGSFQFGGTYSDSGGFSGFLRVTQKNFDFLDLPAGLEELVTGEAFAGGGQVMSVNLQPGNRRSVYQVSWTEPWFLDRPMSLSLSGSRTDRDRRFYRDRRNSGSIGLGWRWEPPPPPARDFGETVMGSALSTNVFSALLHGLVSVFEHVPGYTLFDDHALQGRGVERFWERGWYIRADYTLSRVRVTDIDDDAPSDVYDVEGRSYLSSVSLRVGFERLDNPARPSRGVLSEISYKHTGYPIGGDWDYWRYEFENQTYTTLYRSKTGGKTVLGTTLRAGFQQEHYYTEEVPIFDRYYLGGTGSFRGFETLTISPKEGEEPIGGNILAFASAEITFPIVRIEYGPGHRDVLRGALFTDWGTVVARPKDFGDFRWSAGFGFRLHIPAPVLDQLPVSLDFGFPIRKEDDDERRTVHFGFDFGF